MSQDAVTITFPDLSPAEASQLAAEFEAELKRAGASGADVQRQRASADSQDLGSILILAGSVAGPYLVELAKHAGKEFVGGFANESGKIVAQKLLAYLLKKWNTRATVICSGQPPVTIGDPPIDRGLSAPLPKGTRLEDLKTLGVVLVGASQFPHYPPEISSKAFARSAELARQSLENRTIFRDVIVENLFDHDVDPETIVDRIDKFAGAQPDMQDIVLYYCGHGEFLPERLGRHYYLLLKGTRPNNQQRTGLVLNEFTYMMDDRPSLRDRRFYVLLDSCFAGAAVDAFQGGADAAIGAQLDAYLPPKGWALFAASDKKHPAMGADGAGATMFMGGVADVLAGKAPGTPARLTLSDLAEATRRHLARKHPNEAVLPQCHSIRQTDGDISRVPIFWTGTSMPIRVEKSAEAQVSAMELEARRVWPSVENSTIVSVLEDFRRKYASTPYASMAAARIAEVQRIEVERKRREDAARVGKGGPAASGAPMFLGFKAHSPAELAREMSKDPSHWNEARDWWPKRAAEVHQWVLHDLGYRDIAERLDIVAKLKLSPDGELFRACRALSPNDVPRFLGEPLTTGKLNQLATGVRSKDPKSTDLLKIIIADQLLTDAEGPAGQLTQIATRWPDERDKFVNILTGRVAINWTTDVGFAISIYILETIIDQDLLATLRHRAMVARQGLPSKSDWYARLPNPQAASPGQLLGLIELAPIAEREVQRHLEEEEKRRAHRRAALWEAKSHAIRLALISGILLAMIAALVFSFGSESVNVSTWKNESGSRFELRVLGNEKTLLMDVPSSADLGQGAQKGLVFKSERADGVGAYYVRFSVSCWLVQNGQLRIVGSQLAIDLRPTTTKSSCAGKTVEFGPRQIHFAAVK